MAFSLPAVGLVRSLNSTAWSTPISLASERHVRLFFSRYASRHSPSFIVLAMLCGVVHCVNNEMTMQRQYAQFLSKWAQYILKASPDYPMKKPIKRVKAPNPRAHPFLPEWRVESRPSPSGVILDITHVDQFLNSSTKAPTIRVSRASYHIDMKQIKLWAKGRIKSEKSTC